MKRISSATPDTRLFKPAPPFPLYQSEVIGYGWRCRGVFLLYSSLGQGALVVKYHFILPVSWKEKVTLKMERRKSKEINTMKIQPRNIFCTCQNESTIVLVTLVSYLVSVFLCDSKKQEMCPGQSWSFFVPWKYKKWALVENNTERVANSANWSGCKGQNGLKMQQMWKLDRAILMKLKSGCVDGEDVKMQD